MAIRKEGTQQYTDPLFLQQLGQPVQLLLLGGNLVISLHTGMPFLFLSADLYLILFGIANLSIIPKDITNYLFRKYSLFVR